MKRKYLFRSRAEAEKAYQDSERFRHVNGVCLLEAMRGALGDWTDWYGEYRGCLVRPDSPTGGYCIVEFQSAHNQQRPDFTAHYVDELFEQYKEYFQSDLRNLAHELVRRRNAAERKEGAA